MPKKTRTSTKQQTRLAEPLRGAAMGGVAGATGLYEDPNMANLPSGYVPMSEQRRQGYDTLGGSNQQFGQATQQLGTANEQLGQMSGLLQQNYDFGGMGQQGIDEWSRIMSGDYLDTGNNPYLQDIVERSVMAGQAPISGAFNQGGRYGSGAFANASMNASTATASRLYGAQYQQERQNMMAAMGQTGAIQSLDERLRNPQIEEARRMQQVVANTGAMVDNTTRGAENTMRQAQNQEYVGQQYEADAAGQLQEKNRQFMWPYMQQQIYEASLAGSPLTQEADAKGKTVLTEPFDWAAMIGGIFSGPSIGGK